MASRSGSGPAQERLSSQVTTRSSKSVKVSSSSSLAKEKEEEEEEERQGVVTRSRKRRMVEDGVFRIVQHGKEVRSTVE